MGVINSKDGPTELLEEPSAGASTPVPDRAPPAPERPASAHPGDRSPDPDASTAFVLGWELAALLRGDPFDETGGEADEARLLRLDALSPAMRARLAVDLIEANREKLGGRLSKTRQMTPDCIDALRAALTHSGEALEQAIKDLHLETLFALAAGDSRLGRAYVLGYELADVCLEPRDQCAFEGAFGIQVVPVKDRLADLASSFPPHSSRAVVLSLRAWEAWAAEPELNGKALSWGRDGAGVKAALERQGTLWRDLLAGDKHGQDMLDTGHYVRAASSLVATMARTLRHFMRPFLWPLAGLAIVFLAGVALLATGSKAAGVILTLASALGITGASIRARLGNVAGELQSQLWGAELDMAIAEAVLTGPIGWDATIEEVPASGAPPKVALNIETLGELRKRMRTKSPDAIAMLLSPDAEFVLPGGELKSGAKEVAEWLCEEPQASRIAADPSAVDAITPGVLVSRLGEGGAVWRVREGKVRWREGFEQAERALQRALSLGTHSLAKDTRPQSDADQAMGAPHSKS